MSDATLRKIDRWAIDFAAAKTALHNLDILVHNLVQGQNTVVSQLRELFQAYGDFAGDGPEAQRAANQASLLDRTAASLRESTAKFAGKVAAQIQQAREQVSFMARNLNKLRSAKPPQFLAAAPQVMQQVPEFLSVFDAYLARLTLELRIQQANFYKELGGAFTHAGRSEPTSSIVQTWLTQFEQIMPAVESLKYVNPQLKALQQQQAAQAPSESQDTVIMAPVKWIHARVTRDIRDFSFSDPRKGFFNKPTHPPKSSGDSVVAAYDFEGQTDSDLSFKRGDVIRVIDRGTEDDPNWWCGEIDGARGLFPRNYIEEQRVAHHDEYIPRRSADARRSGEVRRSSETRRSSDTRRSGEARRSSETRRSGETRRSSELEPGTRGVRHPTSPRRSTSLEHHAEKEEDFGEFNGPDIEHKPHLPRRPPHENPPVEEEEHAPDLPRRPRPSQSHAEQSSGTVIDTQAEETKPDALEGSPGDTTERTAVNDEPREARNVTDGAAQAGHHLKADENIDAATSSVPPVSAVDSEVTSHTEPAQVSAQGDTADEHNVKVGAEPARSKDTVGNAEHTDSAEIQKDVDANEGVEPSEVKDAMSDVPEPADVAPARDEIHLSSDSDDDLEIPEELREEASDKYSSSRGTEAKLATGDVNTAANDAGERDEATVTNRPAAAGDNEESWEDTTGSATLSSSTEAREPAEPVEPDGAGNPTETSEPNEGLSAPVSANPDEPATSDSKDQGVQAEPITENKSKGKAKKSKKSKKSKQSGETGGSSESPAPKPSQSGPTNNPDPADELL